MGLNLEASDPLENLGLIILSFNPIYAVHACTPAHPDAPAFHVRSCPALVAKMKKKTSGSSSRVRVMPASVLH